MESSYEKSREILDISLTSRKSIKDLMAFAGEFVESTNADGLHDVDVALTGLLIDYLRHGTRDMFDTFIEDMLFFLDGKNGDRLKSFIEGERYFYRWEHLVDFSRIAFEEYDPGMTARIVASRKYGVKLLEIVSQNTKGIRAKDLAKELDISNQYLAKLLREFEEYGLILREKGNKMTLVHLDFLGRVFMSDVEEAEKPNVKEPDEDVSGIIQWENRAMSDDYSRLIVDSIPGVACMGE